MLVADILISNKITHIACIFDDTNTMTRTNDLMASKKFGGETCGKPCDFNEEVSHIFLKGCVDIGLGHHENSLEFLPGFGLLKRNLESDLYVAVGALLN